MSRITQVALAAVAVAGIIVGCGQPAGTAQLTVSSNPRAISNTGQQSSTITVTAVDAKAQPGTGTVSVQSTAGSLSASETGPLAAGKAEFTFTCDVAVDSACQGTIRLTATWTPAGETAALTAITTVTVTGPTTDAGAGDGGTDAGQNFDAGTSDGGTFGEFTLDLSLERPVLLQNTGDKIELTATLTRTQGGAPAAGETVTFTTEAGSLAPPPAVLLTTTGTTDATGVAKTTLHVGTASAAFLVSAAARDATAVRTVGLVNVASIEHRPNTATRTLLTVISTGVFVSTPVYFLVKDSVGAPVPNIDVNFRIESGGAAGVTVTGQARTNAMGIVQTTLAAGDAAGTAQVSAVVAATEVPGMPTLGLRATSPVFNIVVGRASDARLDVQCTRKSLGALQVATPPRTDQSTTCRASFTDRNGVQIPYDVRVNWLSEAGQVSATSTAPANSGNATTNFGTSGTLPVVTTPIAGEPFFGNNNPRDGFVTLIASLPGEEEFWDGSGGGVVNGVWDPGEWYVDLPEPFVDSNDNGTWDPGEPWTDTDRVDCAFPNNPPTKNGVWDSPNGCWDRNTTIWRPAHIVYTGGPINGPVSPYIDFNPPSVVNPNQVVQVPVAWYEQNFNRMSSDSPSFTARKIGTGRGSITVTPAVGGEAFGHSLVYQTQQATETSPGVFSIDGPCNQLLPDAGYPATRCLRTYSFAGWKTSPSGGTVTIVGATPQAPYPDGGIPPPTVTVFEVLMGNNLQAGPSSVQFSVTMP